ncbi:MAG TPA: helix-turn-helix domain-containing protein, partial [Acetobacteraceae bacterium]|nr:helix-turn-helix domain-containing protein [Acetobacteraceae bacterium]
MSDLIEAHTPARRRGRPASSTAEAGEVVSLDRAISILEVLASGEGFLLNEIAYRAQLPPST